MFYFIFLGGTLLVAIVRHSQNLTGLNGDWASIMNWTTLVAARVKFLDPRC